MNDLQSPDGVDVLCPFVPWRNIVLSSASRKIIEVSLTANSVDMQSWNRNTSAIPIQGYVHEPMPVKRKPNLFDTERGRWNIIAVPLSLAVEVLNTGSEQ